MRVRPRTGVSVAMGGTALLLLMLLLLRDRRPAERPGGPETPPSFPTTGPAPSPAPNETQPPKAIETAAVARVIGVVFSSDGPPAGSGVRVTLHPQSDRGVEVGAASTDARGVFSLELPAGPDAGSFYVAATDGPLVSEPVLIEEGDDRTTHRVALFLSEASIVKGRAVDPSGAPVPGAEVLVMARPPAVRWSSGYERAEIQRLTADPSGEVQVRVPPGRIQARARRPNGAFGDRVAGETRPGQTLDLGEIPVPGQELEVLLHVEDENGSPVGDAAVCIAEVGAPRFLDGRIESRIHYVSGADGTVSMRLGVRPEPVEFGVQAPEFVTVAGVLSCAAPGRREHRVRLRRRLALRVNVVDPRGSQVAGDLPIDVEVRRSDGARALPARDQVVLGSVDPNFRSNKRALHPADRLDPPRDPICRPGVEPGLFEIELTGPGKYLVAAKVPPRIRVEQEVEVVPHGSNEVVLKLPEGRLVRVEPKAPAVDSPQVRALEAADMSRIWAFPATETWPPEHAWPRNEAERIRAAEDGIRLFPPSTAAPPAVLWLPPEWTHLLVRPFHPLNRLLRPHGRGGTSEDDPGPPPEWVRRLPVPAVGPVVLPLEIPAPAAGVVDVRLIVTAADGRSFGERDVPLRLSPIAQPDGSRLYLPAARDLLTDEFGAAKARIPAGRWTARVAPLFLPSKRVEFVVRPEDGSVEIEIPLGL